MSTLHQLRQGLEHAWDQVSDGWRALLERAGQALTRFRPTERTKTELASTPHQQPRLRTHWALLAAELLETDESIEVRLEVPGMAIEDFDIHVEQQTLVVRGHKSMSRDTRQGNYLISERAYGAFERALALPAPVDDGRAEAKYRDGVLVVRLPKQGSARQRRIPVEVRE